MRSFLKLEYVECNTRAPLYTIDYKRFFTDCFERPEIIPERYERILAIYNHLIQIYGKSPYHTKILAEVLREYSDENSYGMKDIYERLANDAEKCTGIMTAWKAK